MAMLASDSVGLPTPIMATTHSAMTEHHTSSLLPWLHENDIHPCCVVTSVVMIAAVITMLPPDKRRAFLLLVGKLGPKLFSLLTGKDDEPPPPPRKRSLVGRAVDRVLRR